MTQWIEDPEGGRDRGPVALLRAWYEVVVHPFRFFETGIAPGDQAPGLLFAMLVVLVSEVTRVVFFPGSYEFLSGPLFVVLYLGLVVLIVTPAVLHLVAAVTTVTLMPLVGDRAGVSETVQAIAYAGAPCVFAGVPIQEVQALAVAYGALLLVIGVGIVHRTTIYRSAAASLVPGTVVFALGFRGIEAVGGLLRQWFII